MKDTMMMPACYQEINEEEMTYTEGGALLAALGASTLVLGVVSFCNMIWGVSHTRQWIQNNKRNSGNAVQDSANLTVKGVDAGVGYAKKSLWHSIVAVYTASNLVTWWPVTAIAWITA